MFGDPMCMSNYKTSQIMCFYTLVYPDETSSINAIYNPVNICLTYIIVAFRGRKFIFTA